MHNHAKIAVSANMPLKMMKVKLLHVLVRRQSRGLNFIGYVSLKHCPMLIKMDKDIMFDAKS
jgi:hypothetical protein